MPNRLLPRSETLPEVGLSIGDIDLDLKGRRVFRFNRELSITGKEFDLLSLLMRNPGRIFSRELLMKILWRDKGIDVRTVDATVSRARKAINRGFSPDPIESVRFRGYRFSSTFEQACADWQQHGKNKKRNLIASSVAQK
jgi:two-component system phosphate regulon response regulator PhoB